MSSDLAIRETTPNAESSAPQSQSDVRPQSEPQSAHTLNASSDPIGSLADNASIASNVANDMTTGETKVDDHRDNKSNIPAIERSDKVKKRRTRRARRPRWKKDFRNKRLQWSESTEQEVRRLHMKVLEHGQPLAPYNTTQFIMNEHNSDKDIDFEALRGRLQRLKRTEDNDQSRANDPNDEDFYSSPEDESDYLQQQFHEAYDNVHAERLSAMNKNELVQEYLQLEDRVEDLERKLKESTNAQTFRSELRPTVSSEVQTELQLCSEGLDGQQSGLETDVHMSDESQRADDHFRHQIEKLSEENQRLRSDNERLKRIVGEQHSTDMTPDSSSH